MSKSLGITLYSGEEEVKERYKHEKLFELYRSWDLSIWVDICRIIYTSGWTNTKANRKDVRRFKSY